LLPASTALFPVVAVEVMVQWWTLQPVASLVGRNVRRLERRAAGFQGSDLRVKLRTAPDRLPLGLWHRLGEGLPHRLDPFPPPLAPIATVRVVVVCHGRLLE
jgi:hypothetical protein